MFSFEVKVRPLASTTSKVKAMCSVVLNEILEIDGFKLVSGSNGLFVSVPAHKGTGKDPNGNEVEKWYDDVRFVPETGDSFKQELQEEIIRVYNSMQNATAPQQTQTPAPQQKQAQSAPRAVAASANVQAQTAQTTVKASAPAREKKPLW